MKPGLFLSASRPSLSGWPTPVQAGELFNFDFTTASDLGDFTITNPASTWALSGGYLRITNNPGAGGFGNHARYNGYGATHLNNYTIETVIIPQNRVATSYGLTLAMKSVNSTSVVDIQCFFECDSSFPGRMIIYRNGASKATSAGNLAFSVGDRIKLTMTQSFLQVTFTAENLTTPATKSVSYTFSQTNTSDTSYTTAKPAFYSNGGIHDVEYLKYSTTEYKNAKLLCLGNSITMGYSATTQANSWYQQLVSGKPRTYVNLSNPSSKTAEDLQLFNELSILNPEFVMLMIAGNDVSGGIPQATYEANYNSIVSQLRSQGATIIHCYAPPRDATNMTTLNNFIATFSPSDLVIDTFTPLKGAGTDLAAAYDNGDGTHLNNAGHALIADTIEPEMPNGIIN